MSWVDVSAHQSRQPWETLGFEEISLIEPSMRKNSALRGQIRSRISHWLLPSLPSLLQWLVSSRLLLLSTQARVAAPSAGLVVSLPLTSEGRQRLQKTSNTFRAFQLLPQAFLGASWSTGFVSTVSKHPLNPLRACSLYLRCCFFGSAAGRSP